MQRRVPKRGFTNIFKTVYSVVNISDLQRFPEITDIGPQQFIEAGLVKKRNDGIKLLADGDITRAVTIKVHKASEAAVKKVEAAGGRIEYIAARNITEKRK